MRVSLDLDFSIEGDFPDLDNARDRIFRALKSRFDSLGYVVFDEIFMKKPTLPRPGQPPMWGGYQVEFKLIEQGKFARIAAQLMVQNRQPGGAKSAPATS